MWNNLKRFLTINPLGAFIWGIIAKWYITLLIASVIVMFWTLKGLEKAGVLQRSWDTFIGAIEDAKSVAKYCVPKISDRDVFWNCLQNPDNYKNDSQYREEEKQVNDFDNITKKMQQSLQKHLEKNSNPETFDPYETSTDDDDRSTDHE